MFSKLIWLWLHLELDALQKLFSCKGMLIDYLLKNVSCGDVRSIANRQIPTQTQEKLYFLPLSFCNWELLGGNKLPVTIKTPQESVFL